ncbi:MAG: BspA family leucine-rich repeat surface protein [Flavobacteriaceae bacterium]|nr:BspA family leucine-rich repeat surface protein [Flavobacteriaceae bacterium]
MASKNNFFNRGLKPFIATFRTTSDNESVVLPYIGNGLYTGSIDWGDGTITPNNFNNRSHTYLTAGDYDVYVYGKIFKITSSGKDIINIKQWGDDFDFGDISNPFQQMNSLFNISTIDTPKTSVLTSMANFMYRSTNANCLNADLSNWDVSSVENFNQMVYQTYFNGNIGSWDVSSAESFIRTFYGCVNFNQDIGNWNTLNVKTFIGMFLNATSFNQDISNWNFSSVNDVDSFSDFMRGKSQSNYNATYYDNLLIKWASDESVGGLPVGIVGELDMGSIKYTSVGASARQSILDNNKATTITDGGQI